MWVGVVAALWSLPGPATAPAPDTLWDAAVEVPFVAQGPLLCGGAAAAMIERYWGARGVYGEDFRHLVSEVEGGIRASRLTSALRDRGYDVEVVTGDADAAFAALGRGVPPILLLESGATRLHYVVLVELDDGEAWIHDPNFGPRRRISVASLLRRWAASGFWSLAAVPSEESGPGASAPDPTGEPTSGAPEAVERLRRNDLAGARGAARALLTRGGEDARLGRRVLATSWFLDGDAMRALGEWNALGEPTIDLVRIEGAAATRYHVAAARMSLGHGEVLTPEALELARRRLEHLPSVDASRITYAPLPDGSVEVRASVAEPATVPGLRAVALQGLRGLLHERATLELGPLLAGSERWRVAGSWTTAQRYLAGSMSTPAPPLPGVASVGMEVRRERFGLGAPDADGSYGAIRTEKSVRGSLGIEEWVAPRVRLGVVVGVDSWEVASRAPAAAGRSGVPTRTLHGALAAHWATVDDRSWITMRGAAWTGAGTAFGRARLEAGVTVPRGGAREWRLRAGAFAVSSDAPSTLWPGAGIGRVRDPLLRAHRLTDGDVIGGPSFGRQLLHGSVEHRVFRRFGAFRLGASLFADAAYVRLRADGGSDGALVDVGASVFVGMGSREGALSLARGESGWRLSARMAGSR